MKKEFTQVTIDKGTYDKLTKLAFACGVSRAEYIRQFSDIHYELLGQPKPIPINKDLPMPTLAQAIAGDTGVFKVVIEEQGQIVEKYLRDLPLHRRVATQIYASRGKTIVVKKWVREILTALALPLQGVPKELLENIQVEK